jgi:aromatic-amino-acid transaminase
MLQNLKPQPADKIIALMGLYAADTRPEKIDLGVGVYKDPKGRTPVLSAVKRAERILHDKQDSKSYIGLLGDLSFVDAMRGLILGDAVDRSCVTGAQTPGGTGAIHQLFELILLANPDAVVWLSDPTWPNHPAILNHLGMKSRSYRYFDAETRNVDFGGMMADLAAMRSGDVCLLHGCCHNPTGANLALSQWQAVTDVVLKTGAIPMLDVAYQGFGDSIDEDVEGLRELTSKAPQTLIAASCSKNFGLYRDRVGVALAVAKQPTTLGLAEGALASLNRVNYSFPPDHGAAVVSIILNDADLTAEWKEELADMRHNMLSLRSDLADALRRSTNSNRFDFVARHRGMFSRLGIGNEQVIRLREDHGIYMVGDSRINVAGIPADRIDRLASAIAAVSLSESAV